MAEQTVMWNFIAFISAWSMVFIPERAMSM